MRDLTDDVRQIGEGGLSEENARIPWKVTLNSQEDAISALALGRSFHESAVASAERSLVPPSEYGVPVDVDAALVFRFSRVVARPRGFGGGSAVLEAVLDELDRRGAWGVLEASPYAEQDPAALVAFYERHGFQRNLSGHIPPSEVTGMMFRPPGGRRCVI